jgi:hypothetical protein
MVDLKKIIKNKGLVLVMLFSLFILLLPQLRLFSNLHHLDSKSYYHLRVAEDLKESGFVTHDELSYNGRPYYFNLSDYILSKTYLTEVFARILPIIFGILSVFLLYRILEHLNLKNDVKLLMIILLVSSPVFIFIFSTFNYLFMAVFLNLLIFYLILNKKLGFSIFLIILMPLFNLRIVPLTLLLLLVYYIRQKEIKKLIISCLFLLFSTATYYLLIIYPKFIFPDTFLLNQGITNIIYDFGSFYGAGIFVLLLALVGFIILWREKKENFFFTFILVALLITAIYMPFMNIFLMFLISYLGAVAFFSIIKTRWEFNILKNATITLIVLGLLFSTTSFISGFVENEPINEQVESLVWLSKNSDERDIVFSHYKNGFLIEYFSERPVVMDEMFLYAPDFKERLNDSNTIFHSRSLETTKSLLNKYDVKYIWVDEKMKSGLVWNKEEQGLLFLFKNKETFLNIYDDSDIEIWLYLG